MDLIWEADGPNRCELERCRTVISTKVTKQLGSATSLFAFVNLDEWNTWWNTPIPRQTKQNLNLLVYRRKNLFLTPLNQNNKDPK